MINELLLGNEFPDYAIKLINNARVCIDILVYEWRFYPDEPANPTQRFTNAIIAAKDRGVKVRAAIGKAPFSSIQQQTQIPIRVLPGSFKVHSKVMIIDRQIAIFGSHNYSLSAFTTNHEISLVTDDIEIVTELFNYINPTLS